MARYILNSAVITAPGVYEYRLITPEEAREWLRQGDWVSTVGYAETAEALATLAGMEIPVNRVIIKMEPGDEALVFRVVLPPGTPRITPEMKGMLTREFIEQNSEIGILKRLS